MAGANVVPSTVIEHTACFWTAGEMLGGKRVVKSSTLRDGIDPNSAVFRYSTEACVTSKTVKCRDCSAYATCAGAER